MTPPRSKHWYREVYLHTPHWTALRERILRRDGKACASCGAKRGLDVHHVVYGNLFKEQPEELVTLCRRCHELAHTLWPQPPSGFTAQALREALLYFLFHRTEVSDTASAKAVRKRENLFTALPKALQAAVRDRMAVHEKEQPKRKPAQQGGPGLSLVEKYGEAAAFLIERIRQEEQHGDRGKVARGYRWFHIPPQEWMEKTDSLKTGRFHAAIRELARKGVLVFCPTDGGKEKIRHYRLTI